MATGTNPDAMAAAITKLTDVLDNKSKNTSPTAPKMGKLIEEDGVKVFEMGGIPDTGWTKLVEATPWKHSGQIRSLDKSKTHRLLSNMKPLDTPWTKSQRLTILQKHIIRQAGDYGMQQNCYLKHPTKNEMVNVVQHPHLYSGDLPLLIKNVKAQMTEYDRYDSANDRALQTCILGSIDSDLSMQVSGLSDMADGALVTWIKIVRESSIMTNEKKTAIMKHIEGTTIQSFQGMNVSTAVEQLKPLCATLVDTRDYDPLLSS